MTIEIHSPEERDIWVQFARAAAAAQAPFDLVAPTVDRCVLFADAMLDRLRNRNPSDPIHTPKVFVPTGPDGTPTGIQRP